MRFDALAEMRHKYPRELSQLSWSTIYTRPDLQIRTIVLMMRDNYKAFEPYAKNNDEAYAFADAAYNGGLGGVNKERRACKLSSSCDPGVWFGNVENFCLKSRVALYGNRSACDINRHHVKDVLKIRADKYKILFHK